MVRFIIRIWNSLTLQSSHFVRPQWDRTRWSGGVAPPPRSFPSFLHKTCIICGRPTSRLISGHEMLVLFSCTIWCTVRQRQFLSIPKVFIEHFLSSAICYIPSVSTPQTLSVSGGIVDISLKDAVLLQYGSVTQAVCSTFVPNLCPQPPVSQSHLIQL